MAMKNLICVVALACLASVRAENLLVNPDFDRCWKELCEVGAVMRSMLTL